MRRSYWSTCSPFRTESRFSEVSFSGIAFQLAQFARQKYPVSRPPAREPHCGAEAAGVQLPSIRIAARGAAVVATLAFSSGGAHAEQPPPSPAPAAVLNIVDGAIVGVSDGTVESFKGIPYAAPPVGALRWRPPVPPEPWSGTRDASQFGASCMQPAAPRNVAPGSPGARLSEDCLTLNVWAPAKPRAERPVMVWLHGGGNEVGSSADRFADGTAFARDGVVLVSLNYRLGLFGFFAPQALVHEARPGEPFANYGLMDQIAALQWVRRNIGAFGGNPNDVTLFGESAGGVDVVALLTSPSARGLFQRAIVESAGFLQYAPPLALAEAQSASIAAKLGLSGAAATATRLRALGANELATMGDESFGIPIVDGALLPHAPLAIFEAGNEAPLPLIVGTNDNEGSLLGSDPPAPGSGISGLTPQALDALRADYGRAATSDDAFSRLLFRDANFAIPALRLAEDHASRAPTYVYRFDYVLAPLRGFRTGANHGSEIPFVFSSWPIPLVAHDDVAETNTLHQCWVSFGRGGVPQCPNVPDWPAFVPGSETIMRFGEANEVGRIPSLAALELLAQKTGQPMR
jgi:para-nitrobenzyl esterase